MSSGASIVSLELDVVPVIEGIGMGVPEETSVAKHRALREA